MTILTSSPKPAALIGALAVGAVLALAGPASAVTPNQISADPFQNTTSQHATEVEPDTFASGSTVVSAFEVARFFNGGEADVGPATERVSDPAVAFDASHNHWLISSIPLEPNLVVPTVFTRFGSSGI